MEEMRCNSNLLSKFAHSKKTEEEMKRKTIFSAVMALCMGLSLTSCLDSDNDSNSSVIGGFVKTGSYMGLNFFTTPDGQISIYPTTASMGNLEKNNFKMSQVNAAFVQGTYDIATNADVATSKQYKEVSITYAASLDAKVEIAEPGAKNDSVNHQCIRAIDNSNRGNQNFFSADYNKPWFFYDATTLVLPINYAMSGQKLHAFTLVYDPTSSQPGDTTIKLRLCHYNNQDASNLSESYSFASKAPFAYFYAFDLEDAFNTWSNSTHSSSRPQTVTIEFVSSETSLDIKDGQTETLVVERKGISAKQ